MTEIVQEDQISVNDLIVPENKDTRLSDPNFLSQALELLKLNKSKSNLIQSRIVYEVRVNELYKVWPGTQYDTFEEWGMAILEKRRAMVYAIAKVYEAFVVEQQIDINRLTNIDFSKLVVASHHITSDNVEEILKICESTTLYDLQKALRSWTIENEGKPEKPVKFSFEVSNLQADTVREAIDTAKLLVKSEIPGKIIEYICADFLCGAGLESTETHLQRCVEALENAFNVNITVTPKELNDPGTTE